MYREFLVRYHEINKMVIHFDVDGSGDLDRKELKEAIMHAEEELRKRNARTWNSDLVEEKDKREVWGMTMELIPTEAELDIIYEQCDVNEDGHMDIVYVTEGKNGNAYDSNIVLLGDGAGGFTKTVLPRAGSRRPSWSVA